ncbi:MAG: hypothetical protein ACYDC6_05915 [Acidobacteriaceae bacterium]
MKLVFIPGIHSYLTALEALPERDYDHLRRVGDLMDYGPKPHQVSQWMKRRTAVAVRGNHVHAVSR